MQKVYLLLRSNKQTGPYSLEELLDLNLKPFDLVWVEGRSAAWQYPSEVAALKPYVAETPQAAIPFQPVATAAMDEKSTPSSGDIPVPPPTGFPKTEMPRRVFVSVPSSTAQEQKPISSKDSFQEHKAYMPPVEQPAYERKEVIQPAPPVTTQAPRNQKPVGDEEVMQTNYSRSLHQVEEDYTSWVYRQKTKKKATVTSKELVLAVLILAGIGGGYYIMSKPSVANAVLPTHQPAQPIAVEEPKETGEAQALPGDERTSATINSTIASSDPKDQQDIKTKNQAAVSKSQTNSSVPSAQNPMPVEKTTPNIQDDNMEEEPVVRQQPTREKVSEKKKLGEVLRGIFAKREKKQEDQTDAPLEDPKPANNRQATRRDDGNVPPNSPASNEVNTASLMEQVDLSSNAPNSWMMGVKNLKVSLRNRSNATIQAASVMVSYYDENNQLLEKKLVYFSNIAPSSKATVAAPDHKFADHVDLKLSTISAKEDRYVKY